MIAIILSGCALAVALYTLLERSARWYVDAEFTEEILALVVEQQNQIEHLEKSIRQCWPTFKAYGE
jgi:hypothetical protein